MPNSKPRTQSPKFETHHPEPLLPTPPKKLNHEFPRRGKFGHLWVKRDKKKGDVQQWDSKVDPDEIAFHGGLNPETRNPEPGIRNPEPGNLNLVPETVTLKTEALNHNPSPRNLGRRHMHETD